jgi:hypothetical protein
MTTTKKPTKPAVTADQIADLRDTQLLSWAKVAEALHLGSPGAARRLYSSLVRPHTESTLPGTAFGTTKIKPVHLADADLDTLRKALVGKTAVVQRAKGTEDIAVAKVTSVKAGTINLHDGNKARSIKAEAIIATK